MKTRRQIWRNLFKKWLSSTLENTIITVITFIVACIFFAIGYLGSKLFVSGITTEEVPIITISIKGNTNIDTFLGWLLSVCSYLNYTSE